MEALKLENLTIQEYLKLEKETQKKYEFHNGFVYALAGGTLNHGLICGNVYGELRLALKNQNNNCKPLSSEIKLHIESKNSFVYPDAMVICGEIELSKIDQNAVTNPILIVEVLSKSTANYDRGDKFHTYRQLKSLKEYVLIEQNKPVIEIYTRKADLWKIRRIEGLDQEIHFSSIDLTLKLSDLYYDIDFGMKPRNEDIS